MAKFNRGEAIHYQNVSQTVGQAEHNFKVACNLCCNDPECMWRSDCNRCKIASIHRDKVAELKAMGRV